MNFIRFFSTNVKKTSIRINKALRSKVWYTYIIRKNHEYFCYCCEISPITPFNFECGHVHPKSKGGKATLNNLRPLCTLCNRSMNTKNLYQFKELLKMK